MSKADGMNYAPKGKSRPVVAPGEFVFAATGLDHGHINGQCNGLVEAGAELRWVYDPDAEKVRKFQENYPGVRAAPSLETILDDPDVRLVAAAAIPSERGPLGVRVMQAGKDYFTDKTPFTSLAQLEKARQTVTETGRKYMVYFSERLHVECAVAAGDLIAQGAIGKVMHVTGFGPHRLGKPENRPEWFYHKNRYGGILTDIGSHQCEQFLHYAGCRDATVRYARVANYNHPAYPELEDFGEAAVVGDNGASFYFRVDWFTPDGLRNWGDGRTFIVGTDGYIELRKYVDAGAEGKGEHLILVDGKGEHRMDLRGKVGFPFFGQLIRDCLDRTETAMTQQHAFKAAELCLQAQTMAENPNSDAGT